MSAMCGIDLRGAMAPFQGFGWEWATWYPGRCPGLSYFAPSGLGTDTRNHAGRHSPKHRKEADREELWATLDAYRDPGRCDVVEPNGPCPGDVDLRRPRPPHARPGAIGRAARRGRNVQAVVELGPHQPIR